MTKRIINSFRFERVFRANNPSVKNLPSKCIENPKDYALFYFSFISELPGSDLVLNFDDDGFEVHFRLLVRTTTGPPIATVPSHAPPPLAS